MRIWITVTALLTAIAVAGCGSSSSSSSKSPSAVSSTVKSLTTPPKSQVTFTTPKDGATTGSTVTFKVALKGFRIDPQAVGQAPRPGVGHLHFQMDGGKYDFPKYSGPNGLIAKKLGVTGHYSPALAPKITYKHLPKGKHTLIVFLANNNHTNVGVESQLRFTVR
jgi:hypothetical protein